MRESIGGVPASRLLFLSLLGNLFLIGFVAVQWLGYAPPPQGPVAPPPPAELIDRLSGSVKSAEGRAAILSVYEERRKDLDMLYGELGHSQLVAQQAFASDPFDAAAYKTALAARKQAADRFFSAMSEMFLDLGSRLSRDDRERILERGRL
ncbi:periplasmic heavy metal sensor [Dongia sp.]|uniref:periplasmic heavy metal sensor n=1 Tax=Dongia sp. TaxID=1977262 RepID=UPI0035ADB3E8